MVPSKPRWQSAVEWTAALVLAALWFVAGVWKLSDITATQVRMTQALVPKDFSLAAALFFGTAETFAGLLLLIPQWRRWGAWISVGLLSAFMVYIGIHYRALTGTECSCFPWMKRAIGPLFFVEDAGMMIVAVLAGLWAPPPRGVQRASAALAVILLLAGVLVANERVSAQGVVGPESITAEGRPLSLRQGRVLLFFFNPYCPHCFQAAQSMSRMNWQATVVAIPTQAFEEGRGFFQSAGMSAVQLSPDLDKLRPTFPFKDVPYGIALENGRVRDKVVFFEEPDLGKQLRQIGFIR